MNSVPDRAWRPVSPIPKVNGSVEPVLKTADSLRAAWKEALRSYTED